jgi:hypothetical protein
VARRELNVNRLPPNLPSDTKAIRYAYGHLLGKRVSRFGGLLLPSQSGRQNPSASSIVQRQVAPDDATNTLHHRH